MRFLFVLTTLSLALAGCNGGEDFSDATVPGCPAGAGCTPSSRGDVLVELAGPHVSNLGYTCTGTNVVFFTSDTDQQSVDSNGNVVTVPAFNALCPANSQGIEFLVGNALFEGNYISLGSIRFPSKESYTRYAVTVADLKNSPFREASSEAQSRNVAAFIQGLDVEPSTPDVVEIPDEAHQVYDDNAETYENPIDTATYADFRSDWDPYFVAVNNALVSGSVAGMDPDPNVPLVKVQMANRYTSAGSYFFQSCIALSPSCLDPVDLSPTSESERVAIDFPGRINQVEERQPPLILPNGKIMGLGFVTRGLDNDSFRRELVAFSESSSINELLQFQDTQVISIEQGSNDTNLAVQGRFLNKVLYDDDLPDGAVGATDFGTNYPSLSSTLADMDKGRLEGDMLGDSVDLPFVGELVFVPQAEPSQDMIMDLALAGPFTVRLMRACIEQDESSGDCTSIPNPDLEVANDNAAALAGDANYFFAIGEEETETELPRDDFFGNSEFCLDVIASPGSVDNGILVIGPADGSCPTPSDRWPVGFISRTFPDSNSVNITMVIAPDASDPSVTANFGTAISGRVDLDDPCKRLYRTGDTNFDLGLRARWEDNYFSYIKGKELVANLPAPGPDEPANSELDLNQQDKEFLAAIRFGAVEFFTPAGSCDPLAP